MGKTKKLNRLLPLVAIGTVADCQSIIEPTNRLLTAVGLQVLSQQNHQIQGLQELLEQTGLQAKINQGYKLTSQELGYILSPILNSSGRLSHASLSISTLIETDQKAKDKASKLIETNTQRKEYVKEILVEVETEAERQIQKGQKSIWLKGSWSKGIVGLIASRLVNRHQVPVIVCSENQSENSSNKKITASLRAPEGYHLPNAMQDAGSELFTKFGGHPGAAGFSSNSHDYDTIKKNLSQKLILQARNLSEKQLSYLPKDYSVQIPTELEPYSHRKENIWLQATDLSPDFLAEILSLDPFGQDFLFPNLIFPLDTFGFSFLGDQNLHLKLRWQLQNGWQECVCFNIDEKIKQEFANLDQNYNPKKLALWIQARVSQNSWNGHTRLQLIGEIISYTKSLSK